MCEQLVLWNGNGIVGGRVVSQVVRWSVGAATPVMSDPGGSTGGTR